MITRSTIVLSRALPLADDDMLWTLLDNHGEVVTRKRGARASIARCDDLKNAIAMVTMVNDKIDAKVLDCAPKLRAVSNYAVGFDNIDLVEASKRGIIVCNTPDVLTNATAEMTIALIFAAARRFKEAGELLRTRKYKGWEPTLLLGSEIHGSTLGIVGYGRVGRAVAQKAQALGMKVIHTGPASLDAVLRDSDFLSIHCPLLPSTKKLIGAKQFQRMKKGAYLINTARGEIVDETALLAALNSGKLRGAALDVFTGEPQLNPRLRSHPTVFVLPHIGSATSSARRSMAELALKGILDVLDGKTPKNRIN